MQRKGTGTGALAPLPRVRLAAAVGIARLARHASRALGRGGGSTVPGILARYIAPDGVPTLAGRLAHGSVVVAGTNGKTTTSRMLAGILRRAGLHPLHNREGANLVTGIATTLATNSSLTGHPFGDIGLFEVDEANVPAVVAQVQPRVALLLNLFRDQLDRYGELDRVATMWESSLFGSAGPRTLAVNADDPGLAALGEAAPERVIWYGIADASSGAGAVAHAADALYCRCGSLLVYDAVLYAHLGHWRCPNCGRRRPQPAVSATEIRPNGLRGTDFTLRVGDTATRVTLPLPGLYNVGNAVAAAAAATALHIAPAHIAEGLSRTAAAFGRLERVQVGGQEIVLWLVKNPAGFNEALRTLLGQPGRKTVVIAINDRIADGRDVSWLWDVDVEALAAATDQIAHIVCAGSRAHDMAVRLKYAGMPAIRQSARVDPVAAVQRALELATIDAPVFVFPTYTAMLDLRAAFRKLGWVGTLWND